MVKILLMLVCLSFHGQSQLHAQPDRYVGVMVGVSTLSADARSFTSASTTEISLYKPENGAALNVLGGVNLTDYLSLQGNYVWNRNELRLTASSVSETGQLFYEQHRGSSQHSLIGDLLVYFRHRRSWVRPYLSVGGGAVRFDSRQKAVLGLRGSPSLPPDNFSSTRPALRVAVGIDAAIRENWALRYSFSETIRRNPISLRLSPPGQRNLANFQNLVGLVIRF